MPLQDVYGQIPGLGGASNGRTSLEMGLFWAIDPSQQHKGYASEAAQTLIDFAFTRLRRILATTEYDNIASQAVMRKLGMRLLRNSLSEPAHLQVVALLENRI